MEKEIYAGFWKRAVAYFIDIMLFCILIIPYEWIKALIYGMTKIHRETPNLDMLVLVLAAWIYFAVMESSKYQATIGKKIVKIKVTDENFHRISFLRATARFFGRFLCMLTYNLGYFMIAFTEHKQGLHDLIAKCYVVNKKYAKK